MRILATAVDSGDGNTTKEVRAYCTPRVRSGVMAIKGEDGFRRPILERSRSKAQGRLWIVGSDAAKSRLFASLAVPGAVRFSGDLPPHWFEQLASERKVVRYTRGKPVERFERIPGRRAEALDSVVYGIAARQAVAPDWANLAAQAAVPLEERAAQREAARQAPARAGRDSWIDRGKFRIRR